MKLILETKRLRLREYLPEDFPWLHEILSDKVTMQHYPKPYDEEGTWRWLYWSMNNYKVYGFGLWAIEIKATGECIGDCGITMQNIDGETLPEIGYHISRHHWRKGYAKEAASAVRDWFFENTDFPAVYSYMTASNDASAATAASVGMAKKKEYTDYDGLNFVYELTKTDWNKNRILAKLRQDKKEN